MLVTQELHPQSREMADILDKIGRYFAEQEAQMRAHCAEMAQAQAQPQVPTAARRPRALQPEAPATATSTTSKATVTAKATLVARRRVSLPPSTNNQQSDSESATPDVEQRASLTATVRRGNSLRRRLWDALQAEIVATTTTSATADDREDEQSDNNETQSATSSGSGASLRSRKPRRRRVTRQQRRRPSSADTEALLAQQQQEEKARRAAEGHARAQERARRIQMQRLEAERQQESEREENLARLQEELRKIDAIRQRGRQFALRLTRPRSAPATTPKTMTPTLESPRSEATESKDADAAAAEHEVTNATTSFLSVMERREHRRVRHQRSLSLSLDVYG
ncbi:hypothetical protein PINS_up008498 [Pythium insidiosum]|nr:hypothetical protein PINS_up008498 [Pythium insidiosum]